MTPDHQSSAELSPSTAVAGIDIGGTQCKLGLWSGDQQIITHQVDTPQGSADAALGTIAQATRGLLAHPAAEGLQTIAVGAGVPGLIERDTGTLMYSRQLGWEDVPIAETLESSLGLPVRIDHDAYLSGLAELELGSARGHDHVLSIAIGTGIGSALLRRDSPWRGASHIAGELGQTEIGLTSLEALASASAIGSEYSQVAGQTRDARWVSQHLTTDNVAAYVWDRAIRALAAALHNAIWLLDPSMIVVGGGLACAGDALVAPLRERLQAHTSPRRTISPIVIGDLGIYAAAGAALSAHRSVSPSTGHLKETTYGITGI